MCKSGFVGAGGVAARHARTLALLPQARLIAVTDVDLGRATRFAASTACGPCPPRCHARRGTGCRLYPRAALRAGFHKVAAPSTGVALFVEKLLGDQLRSR
jgi:myo-inositol 2-dehydrogenase / D-chiro-inositol 1-dehydrogenase